jgi:hypothetical protein
MKQRERECLIAALRATQGIKFKAARLLGISRKTLWEKLKAHDIKELGPDDGLNGEGGSGQLVAPDRAQGWPLSDVCRTASKSGSSWD